MPSLVILNSCPPYTDSRARDALDFALAGATFAYEVSMVFLGEGVFQLVVEQNPHSIQQKNISKQLACAPLYGIDRLYAVRSDLKKYALRAQDLLEQVTVVEEQFVRDLLAVPAFVVSF